MNQLDIRAILQHIPHRYPFLLIDKIVDYVPGEYLIAQKNVTINEPFFTGHFPEVPIMPGVLIIEALAQASGTLIFKTTETSPDKDNWFYLAGVDNARFRKVVQPGDILALHVEIIRTMRGIWKFNCKATVDEQIACVANITCAKGTV